MAYVNGDTSRVIVHTPEEILARKKARHKQRTGLRIVSSKTDGERREMVGELDLQRAQILRQQCNRHFAGKNHMDVVGAIQMLTADALMALPGITEEMCLDGSEVIASDVKIIIRERFGMRRKSQ